MCGRGGGGMSGWRGQIQVRVSTRVPCPTGVAGRLKSIQTVGVGWLDLARFPTASCQSSEKEAWEPKSPVAKGGRHTGYTYKEDSAVGPWLRDRKNQNQKK